MMSFSGTRSLYSPIVRCYSVQSRLNQVRDFGCQNLTQSHEGAYAKSLAVLEKKGNTHYVFHHGQSGLQFVPLNILKKFLLTNIDPQHSRPENCFLRHPANLLQLDPAVHTVKWFTDRIKPGFLQIHNDVIYKTALIAADGHLASKTFSESALSHFSECSSNYRAKIIQETALSEIVRSYFLNQEIAREILSRFSELNTELPPGAILYNIQIPKENFSKCAYLSRPGGVPYLTDHPDILLEKMQREESPNESFPQTRILNHLLEQNSVQASMFTTLSDEQIEEIIEKVRKIVTKYWTNLSI